MPRASARKRRGRLSQCDAPPTTHLSFKCRRHFRPPGQARAKLQIVKPRVLRPGDTVGIVSPSTQVTDPDRLQLAQRTVEYFGLKPRWGSSVRSHRAQGVATVAERVNDLHEMFRDSDVRGIFCIRGGYGASQLLADLDYDLIRRNPKVFVGYSDITPCILPFTK